jgi:hypothetical protein
MVSVLNSSNITSKFRTVSKLLCVHSEIVLHAPSFSDPLLVATEAKHSRHVASHPTEEENNQGNVYLSRNSLV